MFTEGGTLRVVVSLRCTSDSVWCLFCCMHLEPLCMVRLCFSVWMCLAFSVSPDRHLKQMTRLLLLMLCYFHGTRVGVSPGRTLHKKEEKGQGLEEGKLRRKEVGKTEAAAGPRKTWTYPLFD
jgi:hypothetical protein